MEPNEKTTSDCAQEINSVLVKYGCSISCERVDVPNGFLCNPVVRINPKKQDDTKPQRSEEAKSEGESNKAPSNN